MNPTNKRKRLKEISQLIKEAADEGRRAAQERNKTLSIECSRRVYDLSMERSKIERSLEKYEKRQKPNG